MTALNFLSLFLFLFFFLFFRFFVLPKQNKFLSNPRPGWEKTVLAVMGLPLGFFVSFCLIVAAGATMAEKNQLAWCDFVNLILMILSGLSLTTLWLFASGSIWYEGYSADDPRHGEKHYREATYRFFNKHQTWGGILLALAGTFFPVWTPLIYWRYLRTENNRSLDKL